jgi:Zn-dependent protease
VFIEPTETPWDLRFRLFGIPVRVHPFFWLVMAIFGWPGQAGKWTVALLASWIGAAFVSILIHELGHVVMGRVFGSNGYIVLYGFGGLAVGSNALSRRYQRIFVSFAGPLAQLLLLAVVLLLLWFVVFPSYVRQLFSFDRDPFMQFRLFLLMTNLHPVMQEIFWYLILINLFWPLLNLLPVWPLDGGQMTRDFLTGLMPERGLRLSLGVSMLVAGLCAANAIAAAYYDRPLIPFVGQYLAGVWLAFLFAMLAIGSWQLLQAVEAERRWMDDHWER